MNAQQYPSLFDIDPTLERKLRAWHDLSWKEIKSQKYRILLYIAKHPLQDYMQIWEGMKADGQNIGLPTVVGRLSDMHNPEKGTVYLDVTREAGNRTLFVINEDGLKYLNGLANESKEKK